MDSYVISPIEDNFNKGKFQAVINLIKSLREKSLNSLPTSNILELNYFESRTLERLSNLPKAWENFLKSEKFFLESKNSDLCCKLIITCHKAYLTWKLGKLEEGLNDILINEDFIKEVVQTYKNRKKQDDFEYEKWLGLYHIIISNYYMVLGDLKKAWEMNEASIYYYTLINYRLYIGKIISNFAEIYRLRGEPELALEKFFEADKISQEIDDPYSHLLALYNIGETYYLLDNIDEARHYFLESRKIAEIINNYVYQAYSHYKLLVINYNEKNLLEVEKSLYVLNFLLIKGNRNPFIENLTNIGKALQLLLLGSFKNTVLAQEILNMINSEPILDFESNIFVILLLAEINLLEYEVYNNPVVLKDINENLKNLLKFAEKNNISNLLIEMYILEAKIDILEGNFGKVEKLLIKAITIAKEKHLNLLMKKAETELANFNNQITKWKTLIETNASSIELLELADLVTYINELKRMKFK